MADDVGCRRSCQACQVDWKAIGDSCVDQQMGWISFIFVLFGMCQCVQQIKELFLFWGNLNIIICLWSQGISRDNRNIVFSTRVCSYLDSSSLVQAWNSECCSDSAGWEGILPSLRSSSVSFSEVERRRNGAGLVCWSLSAGSAQYWRWYSVLRAENGIYGSDLLYKEKLLLVCS